MCNCVNVKIGSYDNQVELPRPIHMMGRHEGTSSATICIDRCIAKEVQFLWSLGIVTTGCCCGHNVLDGYIGILYEERRKYMSEVVKTNIKPEDVSKVMKEYDKKATAPKVVNPGLEMVPKTNIDDVIKAAQKKLDPKASVPEAPKKGSKSKEVEKLKEKHPVPPNVKIGKKVVIDMTSVNIDVKFVGKGWRPLDVKLANAAIIKAFKIKIRDEYRKGNK